ncbi:helicase, partial [Romboutsia ilealis]|nr:helicase [Romboutsia ilealis]
AECKRAYERMYAGVNTLRNNENAYHAFLLANRAMFMQRIHIAKQAEMATVNADRYPGDEDISAWLTNLDYYEESDSDCKWRPFQIAFLLMDINSVTSDNSAERSIVDLIWFPTGGGKTEA